jgi:hypothetical protein
MASTHLIITDEGAAGVLADSPQVPGFVMGRRTQTEFFRDYKGVLRDVGVRGDVVGHVQTPVVLPSGEEVLLRCRRGDLEQERLMLADRVRQMLSADEGKRFLEDSPRSPTGEIVVVCTATSDTVQDLVDQLDPRRDAAVIAAPASEIGVWTTAVGRGDLDHPGNWSTLQELGIDLSMTVSQIMVALSESHPEKLLIGV